MLTADVPLMSGDRLCVSLLRVEAGIVLYIVKITGGRHVPLMHGYFKLLTIITNEDV